jgi:hypothetical protein
MTMRRIIEDPSIETVARMEAAKVWQAIEEDQCQRLVGFYHSREVALAENIPRIMKAYGKDVAGRVERAIMSRSPTTVSPKCRDLLRHAIIEGAIRRHGRLRKRDRACMAIFGIVWS